MKPDYAKSIATACDLSEAGIERMISEMPPVLQYVLIVNKDWELDAAVIKERLEGLFRTIGKKVSIHVIVEYRTDDPDEWTLIACADAMYSPGA